MERLGEFFGLMLWRWEEQAGVCATGRAHLKEDDASIGVAQRRSWRARDGDWGAKMRKKSEISFVDVFRQIGGVKW